jgi:hypothetical protein
MSPKYSESDIDVSRVGVNQDKKFIGTSVTADIISSFYFFLLEYTLKSH